MIVFFLLLVVDGRRWNEVRHIKCAINTHPASSDGSSIIEQGNTKVMCNVVGPAEPTSSSGGGGAKSNTNSFANENKVTLSVKATVAPFSTIDRRKRSGNDSRIQEMCLTIQHIFEEAVMGHLQPRSQIVISLYILAQDGGMLQACINAASLALIDAGIPMYDYVCACTAGMHDTEVLLGEFLFIYVDCLEQGLTCTRLEPTRGERHAVPNYGYFGSYKKSLADAAGDASRS